MGLTESDGGKLEEHGDRAAVRVLGTARPAAFPEHPGTPGKDLPSERQTHAVDRTISSVSAGKERSHETTGKSVSLCQP